MKPKLLFATGIVLSGAGLALSLSPASNLHVPGALVTLLAVFCGAGILFITRGTPIDSEMLTRTKRSMSILLVFLGIVMAANLWLTFSESPYHAYSQPLAMFALALVLLLQPRSQGKLS